MVLTLHATCSGDRTIDISSNHLEMSNPVLLEGAQEGEFGDELLKRGPEFGNPVGKSEGKVSLRTSS